MLGTRRETPTVAFLLLDIKPLNNLTNLENLLLWGNPIEDVDILEN
jgi:hypothetical protein